MGVGDNLRKAWDKLISNEPGQAWPQNDRSNGPAPAAPKAPEPITLKPVAKDQPGPASRFVPSHQAELSQPRQGQTQAKEPPVQREATAAKLEPKLQPSRTPGPGPSRNTPNTRFINPTSNVQQQQAAKAAAAKEQGQPAKQQATPTPVKLAAWRREDNQAADKQQTADRTKAADGASKLASFRRPGEAPSRDPQKAMDQARMVDQFKRQFDGPSQDRSR